MSAPPDLPTILTAIQENPGDGARWLTLAGWLWDGGRDDEAAAVRVFWPTLRDNLAAGVDIHETLRQVTFNRKRLGMRARAAEGRAWGTTPDEG